jgi:hypothetical protein
MHKMSNLVLRIFTIMALNCPNQAMRGMGSGILVLKKSAQGLSPDDSKKPAAFVAGF